MKEVFWYICIVNQAPPLHREGESDCRSISLSLQSNRLSTTTKGTITQSFLLGPWPSKYCSRPIPLFFLNTYNGYNGGWPSARLSGWSAADWSRPATNKSMSIKTLLLTIITAGEAVAPASSHFLSSHQVPEHAWWEEDRRHPSSSLIKADEIFVCSREA
jgi:hypothetical protein